MKKILVFPAMSLLVACSAGSALDSAPPPVVASSSRGAAELALRTLKGSVRKENAARYGFEDPEDAQGATLVELRLANKRLDASRLLSNPADESALLEQAALETWAYRTPRGSSGQILVRKANGGTWAPMTVGSTRAMQAILATLARVNAAGGTPTAIVRAHAVSKTFVQYDLDGTSHLVEAGLRPRLPKDSLARSLGEIAETLEREGWEPEE